MSYEVLKLLVTAALVVAVSELAKRSPLLGGLLASLPLVSYLAMIWLYAETRDASRVASFATSVFWLVLPSLVLFALLPPLLQRARLGFPASLLLATAVMLAAYGAMLLLLRRFGIRP